jgi:phosphoribosylformylglycinamidine synthase
MTEIDSYHMAVSTIDDAIGEAVATGADIDHMAIMDNFCWCSSDESNRLGQLLETSRGCYEAAVKYGTPFISGKDSMFNDFRGYDKNDDPIKISALPTLLISTLSVVPDAEKVSTIDFKIAGDKIFVLGRTMREFGGTEFAKMIGADEHAGIVPKVNMDESLAKFRGIFAGNQENLFSSIQHIGAGGLGTALAKSCISGELGATVSLAKIHENMNVALFSESKSRYLISVDPKKEAKFREIFPEAIEIGEVGGDVLKISEVGEFKVSDLSGKYKGVFGDY